MLICQVKGSPYHANNYFDLRSFFLLPVVSGGRCTLTDDRSGVSFRGVLEC